MIKLVLFNEEEFIFIYIFFYYFSISNVVYKIHEKNLLSNLDFKSLYLSCNSIINIGVGGFFDFENGDLCEFDFSVL